jgi:tetratricopeptide (TPR) repeat protein
VAALMTSLSIKETGRALNSLAAIKAYQKHDDEALALYKKAFALDPSNYIFLLNLGDSSRRLGLEREARDYYARGSELALQDLENNPSKGRTRAFVGYFAARLGDASRGRQEIEQALQLAPSDQSVIRRAVLIYEMLHQRDRALAIAESETATPDLLRGLDRHPDLAEFRLDPRFREMRARREKGG